MTAPVLSRLTSSPHRHEAFRTLTGGHLMFRNAILTFGLAASVTAAIATSPTLAAPSITIDGLAGAEHWTWVEAEHAIGGSGGTGFFDSSSYSGWFGNPNYYGQGESPTNMLLGITLPAAMSSNTNVYLRGAVERATNVQIRLDGDTVTTVSMNNTAGGSSGQSRNTMRWLVHNDGSATGINIGAQDQGQYQLDVRRPSGYVAGWRFDGVLIYDGDAVLKVTEPVAGVSANRHWMGNPSSVNSPVIASEPITPDINVTGLEAGHEVLYLLNGQAYTPGTEIGVGDHELMIFVRDGSSVNNDRIAMSGANFTIVPEPASLGLLGAGAILILARRRRFA
ncbi:PEP-CTERM sorting domain-containing protein [Phycisphaerales bacterium AB-hyl4]|uniref:PEP-CTERM sorting domain-containing protein n=1 Tax=Natronomicrosphaera hydrolytica TaxID=3242702 RepID=A0ABV4U4M4_9BACT